MEGSEELLASNGAFVEGLERGMIHSDFQESLVGSLQEENRSLKIKIAGVETLSSLLRGTRDELETVCAEKESLEVELARLQCRCTILEKDLLAKEAARSITGPSKQMFESLLKENKKLKDELKHAKNRSEGLFGAEAMSELVAFKEELEAEIRNLQQAMRSQGEDNSISQTSRLLGQVTKLEYQVKLKEEECDSLKQEIGTLQEKSNNMHEAGHLMSDSKIDHEEQSENEKTSDDFSSQFSGFVIESATQTSFDENENIFLETAEKKVSTNPNQDAGVQRRNPSALNRKNSKRASGEWFQIRKIHSNLFEDDWSTDKINSNEQFKVTQDLLVQANEIIRIMAEENDKLLRVNAVLLQDLAKAENLQESGKEQILDRMKFLFAESSFEADYEEHGTFEDNLINNDHNGDDADFIQYQEPNDNVEKFKKIPNNGENGESDFVDNNVPGLLEISVEGSATANAETEIRKDANFQEKDKIVAYDTPNSNTDSGSISCSSNKTSDQSSKQHVRVFEGGNDARASPGRDSGVDICIIECDHHSPSRVFEKLDERNEIPKDAKVESVVKSKELLEDNLKLRSDLETNAAKLSKAEERIYELEKALKEIEEKEKHIAEEKQKDNRLLSTPGQRLCKSIGHIPSSVKTTTYQRIVFESDV